MQWLKTTLTEIYGLFVDDVLLAITILVWLVAIAALLRLHRLPMEWAGLLLAGGLMLLLVESATRYARAHRTRR